MNSNTALKDAKSVSTKTILLVDDEPALSWVVQAILARSGYRVLIADSVSTALNAWNENGRYVDLLITDVFMPHLTGPELTSFLREYQPGLRVIFMSGASPDDVEALLPQDSTLLMKPMVINEIKDCVERILGR
jgi:two-component system cell cycle sensor histidine kinase/response regulator CckA